MIYTNITYINIYIQEIGYTKHYRSIIVFNNGKFNNKSKQKHNLKKTIAMYTSTN